MYGLEVVRRPLSDKPLSKAIASDLCERALLGKVVIAAENPSQLFCSVRKFWLKRLYRLRMEHAGLLAGPTANRLAERIDLLQAITFSFKVPEDVLTADITFATAEDLARIFPQCKFALITYTFPREELHMLTAWMPASGVVIVYES